MEKNTRHLLPECVGRSSYFIIGNSVKNGIKDGGRG
jgi:hypothetical protein